MSFPQDEPHCPRDKSLLGNKKTMSRAASEWKAESNAMQVFLEKDWLASPYCAVSMTLLCQAEDLPVLERPVYAPAQGRRM